jgi:hypothetical protein
LNASEGEKLRDLGQTWKERLKSVSTQGKDDKDPTAALVRPDGFVAWASESEPHLTAAAKSIERLFANVTSGGSKNSI